MKVSFSCISNRNTVGLILIYSYLQFNIEVVYNQVLQYLLKSNNVNKYLTV